MVQRRISNDAIECTSRKGKRTSAPIAAGGNDGTVPSDELQGGIDVNTLSPESLAMKTTLTDRFIEQICFEEAFHLTNPQPMHEESLVDRIAMGLPQFLEVFITIGFGGPSLFLTNKIFLL
jgi:hypothetical protein